MLRAAPAASLVGLFAWAALDVAAVRVPGWNATLAGLLGAAGVLSLVGWIPRGRPVAWLGLVGLGAAYVGSRLVAHGLDVLPALAFVTLAIVHGELRALAGAIPATSIGSAVLLAGGLVVVAALLALLPLLGAEREA